jgi:AcrR family transcriptional regulator
MPSRTRAAHLGPELRRPLLLDAALPLFAEEGYEAVSMQQIADAARVSKPVLYSCFTSKEELFGELVRREDRRLWDLVEDSVPLPGDAEDHESLLRRGLTGMLRTVAAAPDAFRVIYLQPAGEDRVERGRAHWEQRMAEVIAARALIPNREAAVLGRLLVAAAELGFRTLLEEPGTWNPDELAAYLARTLMRGIPERRDDLDDIG